MQIHITPEQAPTMAAILAAHGEALVTAQGDADLYVSTDSVSFDVSRAGKLEIVDDPPGRGLDEDAARYLASGCGDHSPANYIPDGPRHRDATVELLRLGFITYARLGRAEFQRVTDLGRLYYEQTKGA